MLHHVTVDDQSILGPAIIAALVTAIAAVLAFTRHSYGIDMAWINAALMAAGVAWAGVIIKHLQSRGERVAKAREERIMAAIQSLRVAEVRSVVDEAYRVLGMNGN